MQYTLRLTAVVSVLLPQLGHVWGDTPILSDEQYLNACGPIACYVAMRTLGVDATLSSAGEACGWTEGRKVTLGEMQRGLDRHPQLKCSARLLSPDELKSIVIDPDRVAIVAVRRSSPEVNHTMTIVDCGNDRFRVIDYPELAGWKSTEELADIWDGETLVVQYSAGRGIMAVDVSTVVLLCILAWTVVSHCRNAGLKEARP